MTKPEHKKFVQQLIFTDATISSGRVATTQALSGTGALQMVGQFLKTMLNCDAIALPDPTWGNHNAIFKRAGLEIKTYTYYHPATRGFDFYGMMEAVRSLPKGTAILLHSCAHNPTGVDPTEAQWSQIVEACKSGELVPVIDNAYQGYASGNLEKDGFAQRAFEKAGLEFFVCQSFAKNFGLYGERIGYIHCLAEKKEHADAVLSQLKILIRQAYSSPPRRGAAIVYAILSDPTLKRQWLGELKFMAERIDGMRTALRGALEKRKVPGTWSHITNQIGMFSYTGLSVEQCERLTKEFHIYLLKSGRISMAGVNPGNVDYIADAILAVTS